MHRNPKRVLHGMLAASLICIPINAHAGPRTSTIDCSSDIDADGAVTIVDLLRVLSDWGPCPQPCTSDTDASG